VIDADELAHRLLEEPQIKNRVVEIFGTEILAPDGRVDRSKLGQRVFNNSSELAQLNKLLHGPVLQRIQQLIEKYRQQDWVKAIVLDMPLLVEVGWADRCDKLIFVDCRDSLRAERLRRAGSLDAQELKRRENFQISLDKKKRLADNIVDNNSDFSTLVRQVTEVFSYIVGNT